MLYEVLIACSNAKTDKWYSIGDTVKDGDFPPAVIENWLEIEPPVLKVIKGAKYGSNKKRKR